MEGTHRRSLFAKAANVLAKGPDFGEDGRPSKYRVGMGDAMPRTFVDLTFSASGTNVLAVVRKLQRNVELSFLTGEHDLSFDWRDEAEFESRMTAIHEALAGTGTAYRVHTVVDRAVVPEPVPWPPPLDQSPEENPAFPKKRKDPGLERIR